MNVRINGVNTSFNNKYLQNQSLFCLNSKQGFVDVSGTNSVNFTGADITYPNSVPFVIGANGGAFENWEGKNQELILYPSDKSSADQASIESNIGDYFTQNTPLLDTYTGAAAAYSLRKLRTAYTGDAVEVYNGSSYADIGFNVFGELDTVALAAHCGSNDGFVSKWYCQSGNSNDAVQTNTANMPKIYDGSTGVVTENGKPAVEFDGTTDFFTYGIDLEPTTHPNYSNYLVCTPVGQDKVALNITDTVEIASIAYGRTTGEFHVNTYNGSSLAAKSGAHTINTQALVESYHNFDAVTSELYINNVQQSGTNAGRGGQTDSYIGQQSGNNLFWAGNIQEVITYQTDKSTSDRTNIETNINTFYNIYS